MEIAVNPLDGTTLIAQACNPCSSDIPWLLQKPERRCQDALMGDVHGMTTRGWGRIQAKPKDQVLSWLTACNTGAG